MGVLGTEVWLTLIDAGQPASADPSPLAFLTVATKHSMRADFKPGDGGTIWGWHRLHGPPDQPVGGRGDKGAWSEIAKASVAA